MLKYGSLPWVKIRLLKIKISLISINKKHSQSIFQILSSTWTRISWLNWQRSLGIFAKMISTPFLSYLYTCRRAYKVISESIQLLGSSHKNCQMGSNFYNRNIQRIAMSKKQSNKNSRIKSLRKNKQSNKLRPKCQTSHLLTKPTSITRPNPWKNRRNQPFIHNCWRKALTNSKKYHLTLTQTNPTWNNSNNTS